MKVKKGKQKTTSKVKVGRAKQSLRKVSKKKTWAIEDVHRMTATGIAKVFGISRQAVSSWDCPRGKDGTFDLLAVVQWRREEDVRVLSSEKKVTPSEDMGRLRRAKAAREELKLGVDRKELVERGKIHDGLMVIAGAIRRGGERLERAFGPGAREILDEHLNEAERLIEEMARG